MNNDKRGTDAGHTPTPWTTANIIKRGWLYTEINVVSGGKFIRNVANVLLGRHYNRPDEEAEANAAFIVRAVNAHEELVAALKAAFEFIEARSSVASEDWIDVWKVVSEAIAKAEGK